jgi:hypothetical protein
MSRFDRAAPEPAAAEVRLRLLDAELGEKLGYTEL